MEKNEKEAWEQWFSRCAIVRCDTTSQSILKKRINATLMARMRKLNGALDDLPSHALNFFDSWFCKRKKGDSSVEFKPYKQFIIESSRAQNKTFEQMVYGVVLGKELYTLVRELIVDARGSFDNRLSPLGDRQLIGPAKAVLPREDVIWTIKEVVENFFLLSKKPQQDYDRLISFLDEKNNYKNVNVSKTTFYEQRNNAITLLKNAICSNNEIKAMCLARGEIILPEILRHIKSRLDEKTSKKEELND